MVCSVCNQQFPCAVSAGQCWCMDYPPLIQPTELMSCMCESCLKTAIKQKIQNYVSQLTPDNAHDNYAKDLPQKSALIEEIDYYIENGLYVFTSWFHLKRGTCCKNGCRHCPYGFKK